MKAYRINQSISETISNLIECSLAGDKEPLEVLHVLNRSCRRVLAGCPPLLSIEVKEANLSMHYVHIYIAIHKLYHSPLDSNVGTTLPELSQQLTSAIERIEAAPESWTEYLFSYLKQPLSEKTQLLEKTPKSPQGSPSKYG